MAVSGGRLPFRFNEGPVPSIVRALLGIGSPILEINRRVRQIVGRSVEHRDFVRKKSGSLVDTDPFLRETSAHISAVLYSSADCVNHPKRAGDDFILVHNPKAAVPIGYRWLPVGNEYWIDEASATPARESDSAPVPHQYRTLDIFAHCECPLQKHLFCNIFPSKHPLCSPAY